MERDRKKAEKAKKFAEKKLKNEGVAALPASKVKEKKSKQSDGPLPEYIEETPPGEKKRMKCQPLSAERLS